MFRLVAVGRDFDALVSRAAEREPKDFSEAYDALTHRWNDQVRADAEAATSLAAP